MWLIDNSSLINIAILGKDFFNLSIIFKSPLRLSQSAAALLPEFSKAIKARAVDLVSYGARIHIGAF